MFIRPFGACFYFLPFTVIAVKHPSLILYFILSDAGTWR
ncbi:Uncharacterised protein [Klebsiella michiganensis]|uniref:Uncharacterized protein n=1 Tax=Klebsiella michiganensis TaxID=1134687 RepID=A0A7H4PH23_9ENTR|nr:Uncharacterised protein [Klebsiella michiganensis]